MARWIDDGTMFGKIEFAEMLLSKISVDARGCFLWNGYRNRAGYGMVIFSNKGRGNMRQIQTGAHRVSFAVFLGTVPDGLFVCHRCDVPACINPAHLFVGTAKDNIRDMHKKGRAAKSVGEFNGFSKFSNAAVEELPET